MYLRAKTFNIIDIIPYLIFDYLECQDPSEWYLIQHKVFILKQGPYRIKYFIHDYIYKI